ncbi:MAG: helix-turn-helix transcriptional regulator [Bacteroidales bacterium]|nr:helix-turn-helix transcriptional regulator [Bacteroidales bacterium]
MSTKELSDYEEDDASPPLNIAIRIADILDTSLDFLACRVDEQPSLQLLKWSAEIDGLTDQTKNVLFEALDAIIN